MKEIIRTIALIVAILLALIGIAVLFFPDEMFCVIGVDRSQQQSLGLNEIGDYLSGVTAPFLSLATVILLVITYFSQKEELEHNRTLISNQQFEMTTFNLTKSFREYFDDVTFSGSKGNDAIAVLRDSLVADLSHQFGHVQMVQVIPIPQLTTGIRAYFKGHLEVAQIISMMDYLFITLRYIEANKPEQGEFYVTLLKSKLSLPLKIYLGYFALTGDEYKRLVEKYGLLQHLTQDDFSFANIHSEYNETAFI